MSKLFTPHTQGIEKVIIVVEVADLRLPFLLQGFHPDPRPGHKNLLFAAQQQPRCWMCSASSHHPASANFNIPTSQGRDARGIQFVLRGVDALVQ